MAFTMDASDHTGDDSTTQLIYTSTAAGTMVDVWLESGKVVGLAWVNSGGTTLYGSAQITPKNPQATFGPLANGDKVYMRSINVAARVFTHSVNV